MILSLNPPSTYRIHKQSRWNFRQRQQEEIQEEVARQILDPKRDSIVRQGAGKPDRNRKRKKTLLA